MSSVRLYSKGIRSAADSILFVKVHLSAPITVMLAEYCILSSIKRLLSAPKFLLGETIARSLRFFLHLSLSMFMHFVQQFFIKDRIIPRNLCVVVYINGVDEKIARE